MPLSDYDKARVKKRRQVMKVGRIAYNRLEIFTRDGFMCWLCGSSVLVLADGNDPDKATIDHVVPVSKGGKDTPDNVKTAHRACNEYRGNRSEVQLRLF